MLHPQFPGDANYNPYPLQADDDFQPMAPSMEHGQSSHHHGHNLPQQQPHLPSRSVGHPATHGVPGAALDWGDMNEVAKQYPMAQMGLQMGNLFVQKRMAGMMSWFRLHNLRPYFHVSNVYVLRKLQILMLPFLVKNFRRSRRKIAVANPETDGLEQVEQFDTPVSDPNAPDLYIPLMSLITYILLLGFSHAQVSQFKPEVLGVTTSSAMLLLLLEVAIIKVGFWLIGEDCPTYIDLFALLAYRFVGLILTVVMGLVGGSLAMVIAFCYCSFATAFFVVRSLTASTAPTIEVHQQAYGMPSPQASSSKRRKLLILGTGVLSLLTSIILLRSGSP